MTTALGDLPTRPALVEGTIGHTRRTPLLHTFDYRVYQWLVDLDHLPSMPVWLRPFSTFAAADHLGDPGNTIRENIDHLCSLHGVDLGCGRVLMLANARIFGHTFDPLSVFWCLRGDGSLACIIAEVHNTYGDRHAYVLEPDDQGRATTGKDFYVSPFFTVEGRYDLQFALTGETVSTSVVLRQGGEAVFTAKFRGTLSPASPLRLARLVLTKPFMTQRVSALIRLQGIWLWLKRLPLVARTPQHHQEGVSCRGVSRER